MIKEYAKPIMDKCPVCNSDKLDIESFNDYHAVWCKTCRAYICPECNIHMEVNVESERYICPGCGYMGEDVKKC